MINGYARVSTTDQSLDRQMDELRAAGAERIHSDVGSGKKGAVRPQWNELLRSQRPGDTLMVTELSRLGRSTSQLSSLADDLADRGVDLKILNLGIDTSTSGGKLVHDHQRRGRNGAGPPNRANQLGTGCCPRPRPEGGT